MLLGGVCYLVFEYVLDCTLMLKLSLPRMRESNLFFETVFMSAILDSHIRGNDGWWAVGMTVKKLRFTLKNNIGVYRSKIGFVPSLFFYADEFKEFITPVILQSYQNMSQNRSVSWILNRARQVLGCFPMLPQFQPPLTTARAGQNVIAASPARTRHCRGLLLV